MTAPLLANPWLGVTVVLAMFLLVFVTLQAVARTTGAAPELTRKLFHAGSGALTLSFPFVFDRLWPVLLLTSASAALVMSIKFLPALQARFGGVTNRVDRDTLGELYFPLSVALLFVLTRGTDPLLFIIPVAMLTFADATSALVGIRYGVSRYVGASKSLEGSVAFAVVAFFCAHVPLLLWSSTPRVDSLLIAGTLSLLVMLLEGSAWRGLDNLFIPIGGFFLLRAYLELDTPALAARLIVTVALVGLVVLVRRRTTLRDDSLVAGAFLCYLAWALMGWQWLVGPLALVVGYRWLSPSTPDNERRMHDVPALLSVWAAALAWLTFARTTGDEAMLFPYTTVFAAHLAIFGTSRLAFQFPSRPLVPLIVRAVVTSWAIVMLPFVAATSTDAPAVVRALLAVVSVAIGAVAFVATESSIRNTPQTPRRWVCQAMAAALASVSAWLATSAAAHVLA